MFAFKVKHVRDVFNLYVNIGPKKNCSDGNGGCGQLCLDGDAGLTCSCLPGYIMIGDGRTCKGDFKQ